MISSQPQRILMIAGAPFVHSLVTRFTDHLRRRRPGEYSALFYEAAEGRVDGDDPVKVFDAVHRWPSPVSAPRSLGAASRLLPHLVRGAVSSRCAQDDERWRVRLAEKTGESLHAPHLRRVMSGYDLYHWHCFLPDRLPMMRFLPPRARLIITLWGSDLYRTAGVPAYARQLAACGRATAITMASPEMKQSFLIKFGREWEPRLHILNYGACNLGAVPGGKRRRDSFLQSIGIGPERQVVCVGNNAIPGSRHIEVLRAIRSLPSELLSRIAVIIPMTYGQERNYMAAVRQEAETLPCPVTIIDRFLDPEDAAALRASAEITIHVPVSDQLSAAMCESLYGGSVVITGSWLPYSLLRQRGLYYKTVDDIAQLPPAIAGVLSDLKSERSRAEEAAPRMWDMMAWESVTPRWLGFYDEICSSAGG